MIKATIIRSSRKLFPCLLENPNNHPSVIEATPMGQLLKDGEIVVGDQVMVHLEGDVWTIKERLPRHNFAFRHLSREKRTQIFAANVDLMALVVSGELPVYKQGLLDRYLLRSNQWNIPTLLLWNKMDKYHLDSQDLNIHNLNIHSEVERVQTLLENTYEISAKDFGYQPRFLDQGIEDFKKKIKNKTVIFLGQSGVGKSCLINHLASEQGVELNLKSQEMGVVGKGMHTTTWSELIDLKHFKLIDSPGIRSLALQDLSQDDLIHLMPDLEEIGRHCKFSNCHHLMGSKGCQFFEKPEMKNNSHLHSRLDSFQRIKEEISKDARDKE